MEDTTCFHCGQPTERTDPPVFDVLDRPRIFCCAGCLAVCQAIVNAGHADYYRYRDVAARQVREDHLPAVLQQAELYDRDEIQATFVQQHGDWREASLVLEEIRCAACLWLNERQLRRLDGVLDVRMDYTSHRAIVRWDPSRLRLSEILEAIARIGYVAYPHSTEHRARLDADRRRRSGQRLLYAGAAGMAIMQFSLATYLMAVPADGGVLPLWVVVGRWSSFLAATSILLYSGQDFFVGAWRDLRFGRAGMDVPIALGLLIAWGGSLMATIRHSGDVYYDSIAMFVFLVLLARRAELRARTVAAAGLDKLLKVVPQSARRLDGDGNEQRVAVVDLLPGNRLRLRPGEAVPVDGILIEGEGRFDESVISGETDAVFRRPGEPVVGGSWVEDQPVVIEVRRRAQESTVGELVRLIDRGLRYRPRYVQLADHVAAGFVLAVLALAAVTAVMHALWVPETAMQSTIAVLIVTCPCALALATPIALSLSAAALLKGGVIPLRIEALDSLARIDTFVFDKTGTLTLGRPELSVVESLDGRSAEELLRIARSLEGASEHPLAHAFAKRGALPAPPPSGQRNFPGEGVEGTIAGQTWRLGTLRFALAGHASPPDVMGRVASLAGEGYVVVVLGCRGRPAALFGLRDALRPGARETIRRLQQEAGVAVALLSGDGDNHVARVAARLGIVTHHAEMRPLDKLRWLRRRQQQGARIAMVGDGINDAPTLAAATVSVSFAAATDIAKSRSDFLIRRTALDPLVDALRWARRTRRIIRQNLLWAAGYNLGAVPLAALGYVPPWAAALGMSLSSLLVVGNSLRLRRTDSTLPDGDRERPATDSIDARKGYHFCG